MSKDIHIGKKIRTALAQRLMTIRSFASQLGIHHGSAGHILKKKDIHSKQLRKICEILDHDFFEYFTRDPSPKEIELEQQLNKQNKETQNCKSEIKDLQKQNEFLKEVIGLMSGKKKQ